MLSPFRIPAFVARFVVLLSVLALAACGDSSPTEPEGGGGDPVPNPEGVFLEGEGAARARGVLEALPPSPAPESEILGQLITTRMLALIDASATVDEVNAALAASNARIVAMLDGQPFVTLKVPASGGVGEARTVAAALMETGAFAYVSPAHVVSTNKVLSPASEPVSAGLRGDQGVASVPGLESARIFPAWNVAKLGLERQDRIVVLMPDEYASVNRHTEIDAQQMIGFGAANSLPGPEIYPGNTGFVTAGIVGANVDDTAPTGTSPYPVELLDIRSMPVGGMTWNDIILSLAWELVRSGDEFVLHSGLEYNDDDFEIFSRLERAMQVIAWRFAAAMHYEKFVHVVPAARASVETGFQSPFLAAAVFGDVRDMVDFAELSAADSLGLETAWADLNSSFPIGAAAAPNVITVASMNPENGLSSFSADGDVMAPGEFIAGPCVSQDPAYSEGQLCDGDVAVYSGNSLAAAHVSGVAAYMMSLGDATPAEIREKIIQTSERRGSLDGFGAVLALDSSADQSIREALLDVASVDSAAEDGRFDQWDLEAIINPGAGLRRAPGDVYDPALRRDFNGDSNLGPDTPAPFDLDLDGVYGVVTQMIEGQPVDFDERQIRDIDVVCYYAYSDVYRGDLTVRGQYLLPSHSDLVVEILGAPDRVTVPSSFELSVRAGLRGSGTVDYVSGLAISLDLDGGSASPGSGTTDADGFFTTTVTIDHGSRNEFSFGAWARTDTEEVFDEVSVLRDHEIVIIARDGFVSAEVFALYSAEIGKPSVQIIQQFSFEEITDFSPVDVTKARSGSGSGGSLSVTGSATSTATSRVDVTSGNQFHGMSVTSNQSASVTLSNPNFDLQFYQADVLAVTEFSVEFAVWGDPAQFTLSGSTGDLEYDIDLDGDSQVFECDTFDAPCTTISAGGALAAGYYYLSVDHYNNRQIRWYEGCTDCTTQGTRSSNGSLDLNFEVRHGGARPMETVHEGRSDRFGPRERSRYATGR